MAGALYLGNTKVTPIIQKEPLKESLTITPTKTTQVITAPSNISGYTPITVNAVDYTIDTNIQAENIKQGITILGVTGSFQGEASVEAKAVGTIEEAVENDKVLLVPTDIIQSGTTYSYNHTYTAYANVSGDAIQPLCPGLQLDFTAVKSFYERWYGYNCFGTTAQWNETCTELSTITPYAISTSDMNISISYRDEIPLAITFTRSDNGHGQPWYTGSLGFFDNGVYTAKCNMSGGPAASMFLYIDKHFCAWNGNLVFGYVTGSDNRELVYSSGSGIYTGNGPNGVIAKYNDNWYYLYEGDGYINIKDCETNTYQYRFSNVFGGQLRLYQFYYLDDDTDYFFYPNQSAAAGVYKWNKSLTNWSCTKLSQPTNVISSAMQNGLAITDSYSYNSQTSVAAIQAKDFGEYVEFFMCSRLFGYSTEGNGNKIAHFKFIKATETLERLNDIFFEVPDNYTECATMQVNWNLNLIMVSVVDTSTSKCATYIKKLDDFASIYKYYAFTPSKGNYYASESITGFVKSNEGTDDLGNTIVKVKTVEDPNYHWTPPVNRVFGMNVTVNEGEPV